MKTIEEFDNLYTNDLLPELQNLEKIRKRLFKRLCMFIVTFSICLGVAIWLYNKAATNIVFIKDTTTLTWVLTIALVAPIGVFLISFAIISSIYTPYKNDFKHKVVYTIVHFINPDYSYDKDRKIEYDLFTESSLEMLDASQYIGSDYVSGKIQDVEIQFSKIITRIKKSKDSQFYINLFNGLFFVTEFYKKFQGKTIIVPDIAEKVFGHNGKSLQKVFSSEYFNLINLENSEFEKYFKVYGNDQVTSRYILSTSLMERLVDFQKKHNKKIYVSFINSKIFIAIKSKSSIFDPSIFISVVNYNRIKEYFDYLQLVTGIVDDLKLNTNFLN